MCLLSDNGQPKKLGHRIAKETYFSQKAATKTEGLMKANEVFSYGKNVSPSREKKYLLGPVLRGFFLFANPKLPNDDLDVTFRY